MSPSPEAAGPVGASDSASAPTRQSGLDCRPLTAVIGAEVRGLDLREVDSEPTHAALRAALGRYQVLFFRGQHLDDAAQLALAQLLGRPMVHPFERAMGRSSPLHGIVDKPEDVPNRDGWHTDDSYLECPPAFAILRCEVAPPAGGDTAWANMEAAYESLSSSLQRFMGGLEGFHATAGGLLDYVRTHLPPERLSAVIEEVGAGAWHPIVRTHPETGRRALYFEPNFMRAVRGLSDAEAGFVRGLLMRRVEDVSLQCRFRWSEGDVVIWDERTTQHVGSADHRGQLRVLRRCTVEGERPR